LEHEMTASLEALVIAAYVFADSLPISRLGPAGKATDSELIAPSVAQAAWFPELPGQSQFNRRLRRLAPQIGTVQMMLAELVAEDRVDGTLIQLRQLSGLCLQESLRRRSRLWLLPVKEPVRTRRIRALATSAGGRRLQPP
jgi:predicted ATPase